MSTTEHERENVKEAEHKPEKQTRNQRNIQNKNIFENQAPWQNSNTHNLRLDFRKFYEFYENSN